jgi:hypothetical protein
VAPQPGLQAVEHTLANHDLPNRGVPCSGQLSQKSTQPQTSARALHSTH